MNDKEQKQLFMSIVERIENLFERKKLDRLQPIDISFYDPRGSKHHLDPAYDPPLLKAGYIFESKAGALQ